MPPADPEHALAASVETMQIAMTETMDAKIDLSDFIGCATPESVVASRYSKTALSRALSPLPYESGGATGKFRAN